MKRLISAALLLLFSSGFLITNAQNKQAEQMARKIADRILNSTTYTFVNNKTGEKFETVKGQPLTYDIVAESKYNQWHYTNGVTNIAMLELADKLGEKKYENFVLRNMNFVFNEGNLNYFRQLYDSAFNPIGGNTFNDLINPSPDMVTRDLYPPLFFPSITFKKDF